MAPPSKRARTDDGAASSASAAAAAPASAIPMIGFGTHTLKGTAATRLTAQALAAGYACVDTASIYSNEAEVGAALQKWKGAAPYVITKLWRSKHGDPKKITAEVRSSVRKLGKVDLWLLHWPHPGYPLALPGVVARQCPSSGEWPVAKWRELRAVTWREMAKARQAGTVGAVGLSNVGARLLAEMTGDTGEVPALVQNELHPLNYLASKPWIDWCTKRGVVVQAYSSLGQKKGDKKQQGVRAKDGSLRAAGKEERIVLLELPLVLEMAARLGMSPAALLYRWAAQHGFAVLPRSSSRPHLDENLRVLGLPKGHGIPEADMAKLDALQTVHGERRFTWWGPGRGDPELAELVCAACGRHTGDLSTAKKTCTKCAAAGNA